MCKWVELFGGGGGVKRSEKVFTDENRDIEIHKRGNQESIRKMEARKRWRIFVCRSKRIRGGHGVVVLQITVQKLQMERKVVTVRRCLEQNFLSNPRRIHSEKEDEEKEK